ncbi:MAG: sugar phosphate nucleotidyltransferase [Promethearchaeota archaeon]
MTKAIILSGGWGTRLRPLTCALPKTLIPVVNKPVIERLMILLKSAGVKEIVLAVSVMADALKNYFKDGTELGIKIHYTDEEKPMGTGGALKLAEYYLRDDNFFMINGDEVLNFEFNEMLTFHKKTGGIVTIGSQVVQDPSRYGVLIVDNANEKILKFLEKEKYNHPEGKQVPMPVNAGIYILEPEIFSFIDANTKVSIEKDVFPKLARDGKLYNYSIKGIWRDIGKPKDLLEGNILLMNSLIKDANGKKENLISNNVQYEGNITINPPVTIGDHAMIRYGCEIGPNAIIGDNVFIESSAKIRDSVIYDKTYIGKNVKIEKAIIGDNCRVEDNVELIGNEEALVILASTVEVLKGIKLITPDNRNITFCHHETVKNSIK